MMTMVRISLIVLIFLFVSCSRETREDYYPDGKIKMRAELKNGKRDGILSEYYPNGSLKSKGDWRDDALNGKVEHYFHNGNMESLSFWTNGKENGESRKYLEDGTLYSVRKSNMGKKQEIRVYYKNQRLLERQLYNDEEKVIYISKYDSTGNVEYSIVPPIFKSESDTVSLGESYRVSISFGLPLGGSLKVYTGTLNPTGVSLSDTSNVLKSQNGVFYYTIKPKNSGRMVIPFLFSHETSESDSLSINGILTKHTIYVVDSAPPI